MTLGKCNSACCSKGKWANNRLIGHSREGTYTQLLGCRQPFRYAPERQRRVRCGLPVIRPQSVVSVNIFRSSRDWRSALPLKIHAGSSLLGHVMCVR
jgi:hypothetical protein